MLYNKVWLFCECEYKRCAGGYHYNKVDNLKSLMLFDDVQGDKLDKEVYC